MRKVLACASLVVIVAAPAAFADDSASLRVGRALSISGELEGAATYGPLVPVAGQGLPDECVARGCDDHIVQVVVPRGHVGIIDWVIQGPATGAGLDLRIFDSQRHKVSTRDGGSGAATTSPTTSTQGSTRRLVSGVYTVRASLVGGSAEYKATLTLRSYRK